MNSEELRQWYAKELAAKNAIISSKEQECDNCINLLGKERDENKSLRAENERLKDDHFKSLVFLSDQGVLLGDLRKRCEDLEVALKEVLYCGKFNEFDRMLTIPKIEKLLSQ